MSQAQTQPKKAAKTKAPAPKKAILHAAKIDDEIDVADIDLSEEDFSKWRPFSEVLADLDSERKNKTITLRIPETLLSILKASAKKKNIPYQRLMRQLLAKGLFLPPQS